MSEELAQLEACLKEAETIFDTSIEEMEIAEASQASTETAIHSLLETLRNKEFTAAIAQVKAFRYSVTKLYFWICIRPAITWKEKLKSPYLLCIIYYARSTRDLFLLCAQFLLSFEFLQF